MHTELLVRLTNRNKTESDPYDDIIKNYKELNYKCRSLKERLELIERENNSLKRISGDPALMNELQIRIQSLEKELTDSMRDNNLKSTKLCEILTDKMLMKDQLDNLTNQNATKSSRILELESIVRAQDDQINKLNDDVSYLKAENGKLERLNITLNDNLNKKLVENTLLTNEVLKVKGDFVEKMNEMNDLLEAARKKKVAAEIYFDEKKTEYKRGNNEVNILSSIKDYQIQFEDVIIPKTLKLKFSAHRKALTSLKFNGFGTNFITTGGDNFVKLWDASKNQEIAVFAGFTASVTQAALDHTEQILFAGSMDKTAKMWALKNNKLLATLTGHIDYVNTVQTFYSSQRGLTGSSDRTIKEWDFNTLKLSRNFNCVSSCHSLGISFDDNFIASGHLDGTLKIWSTNDKPEKVIELHDEKISHLQVIRSENQILTSSKDYTIKLFDLRKMETIYTLNEENLSQYCESSISVSSDKKYFSVGSVKGQVFVFNLQTGKLEDNIDNKTPGSILAVEWRPYHSQMYVADSLGFLSIWGTN